MDLFSDKTWEKQGDVQDPKQALAVVFLLFL